MTAAREKLAIYPTRGSTIGILAGDLRISLVDGKITLPGNQGTTNIATTRDTLRIDAFRSAIIYTDQPGVLQVDKSENKLPLIAGINTIQVDMVNEIVLSSYMPREIMIILGAERTPPVFLRPHDFEFRRNASFSATNTADFDTIELRPTDFNPSYDTAGASNGYPAISRVFPNSFDSSNQGAPIVSALEKKVVQVRNTGTAAVIVKLQGRQWADHPFIDLDDITGPDGTLVEVGEVAKFSINEQYYQIMVVKRTLGSTGAQFDLRGQYRP